MDYIVMDLEWNQNPYGKSHCHTDLTFEIIEIGAVRVSDDRKTIVDSFQQVIKPRVFKKLHYKIQEITHFTEEELNDGKDFRKDESFPPLQKKDVVLSGHTHIPITEPTDGGLFFNPGSVSIPKNGSKNGYMTLENGLFIWKSFEDGEYARYKL
mgnify:CR=1 FL=1